MKHRLIDISFAAIVLVLIVVLICLVRSWRVVTP